MFNTTTTRERELEREADDLRYQLEEKRREENRRRDEEEERRREQRAALNPSNRLYRGEIHSFREAIELHIQLLRHELGVVDRLGFDNDEEEAKYRADFEGYIADAETLLREYEEKIGAAERALFEEWTKAENGSSRWTCGQCGLSGDYSPLAI